MAAFFQRFSNISRVQAVCPPGLSAPIVVTPPPSRYQQRREYWLFSKNPDILAADRRSVRERRNVA